MVDQITVCTPPLKIKKPATAILENVFGNIKCTIHTIAHNLFSLPKPQKLKHGQSHVVLLLTC